MLDSTKKVTDWHDLLFIDESYERWTVHFMTLIRHCDLPSTLEICDHLTVAPRYAKLFGETRIWAGRQLYRLERRNPMKNADIYKVLKIFKTETILYMMACTQSEIARKRISLYHTRLRNVSISISGKDLLEMGLKPGPLFSRALESVLEARLNGTVATRDDELAFVHGHVKENLSADTVKDRSSAPQKTPHA